MTVVNVAEQRRTEELYRSVVELAPDSIITVDMKGMITSCNTAATRILGYSRDELVGKHFSKIGVVPFREMPKYLKLFQSAIRGEVTEPLELTFYRKDGTPVLTEVRVGLLREGNKAIGLQAVSRDITERKRAEDALRESEARFRHLFEASPDPIFIEDLEGSVLDVNPAACRLHGMDREDLIGKNARELVPPDKTEDVARDLVALTRDDADVVEGFSWTQDGRAVPVEIRASPIEYKGKQAALLHVRNVTERKQIEQEIRRRSGQLSTLNAAAAAIQRAAHTPEAVFTAVMEQLQALGLTGAIVLLDETGEQFTIRYVAVASQALAETEKLLGLRAVGHTFSVDDLPIGRQILAGETLFVSDTAALAGSVLPAPVRPLIPTVTRLVRLSRGVIAPLSAKGEIIGFLGVSAESLTETDLSTITAFANQAAIAVENARLYQGEQQRREEAETLRQATQALSTTLDLQEVFKSILSELQRVVPYDSASVQLLKGNRLEIIGDYGFPNLEELLGLSFPLEGDNPNRQVMATRAPFIVEDAPAVYSVFGEEPHAQAGIRAWLGVPLLFGDRVIGMIALDKRVPGFYTEEHARLALAFAAQAAIAIENARLYEEERRLSLQRKTIAEVGRTIAAILDVDALLSRVVDLIRQNFGYYFVHLFEVDADAGYAVLKAGTGEVGRRLKKAGVRLKIGEEGIIGWVERKAVPESG